MDLVEIMKDFLETYDIDGLANPCTGCTCRRDALAPCGEITDDCVPYRSHNPTEVGAEEKNRRERAA